MTAKIPAKALLEIPSLCLICKFQQITLTEVVKFMPDLALDIQLSIMDLPVGGGEQFSEALSLCSFHY